MIKDMEVAVKPGDQYFPFVFGLGASLKNGRGVCNNTP